MSLRGWLSRLSTRLGGRARFERDLDDELNDYLERRTTEHERAGTSRAAARRAALLELGGATRVKEQVREVRLGTAVDQARQDLGYAVRMLARSRGFTVVAAATLALGIGANTAIFSVVDTVVFRPLPYADPARLVKISGNRLAGPPDDVSLPDFLDLREQGRVFQQLAADDGMGFTIRHADGSVDRVNGAMVTSEWLSTLGVRPFLGRAFLPEETLPGRDRVVVLSHAFWRRRFGADPAVVGTPITVDGAPFVVVGVLPPNVLRYSADFIKPLVTAEYSADRGYRDLDVFARLAPGVTRTQAQAQLDTVARRLAREYPGSNAGRGFTLAALDKSYAGIDPKSTQGLLLVLGAVAFVLLIACANVTNLLFARAVSRDRECMIRAALGASRARLVRQLLVEHLLLFLIGGGLAVILAGWSVDSLVSLAVASHYLPERMSVAVDGRVFLFSFVISLLAGLSFGLSPALQASRVDLTEGLKASSRTLTGDRGRHRASRLLMVSELALSVVLLVGFGLLSQSFLRVYQASGGFSRENLLVTESDGGRSFVPALAFWRRALDEARRDPGVRSAALTSRPPVHGVRRVSFAVGGHALSSRGEDAGDVLISADYFRTMDIRLVKGRAFTERDDGGAPPVVVISESLARAAFKDQNPLGHRLQIDDHGFTSCCSAAGPVEGVEREIVGVVSDIRQGNLDEPPAMTLYRPYSQIVEHDMYLVVRAASAADATRLTGSLGARLLALDPRQEWADVRRMSDVIGGSESIQLRRFVLILLGGFAGLALLLAAIGTYGVMAYAVAGRTQEIGIRMALGATRLTVCREILAETLTMTLAGLAVGSVAAYLLSRFITAMLFGVGATDVATYAGVSLLLVGVALVASYLPASRAMRVDPTLALREQ